jgi:hypothetical protein
MKQRTQQPLIKKQKITLFNKAKIKTMTTAPTDHSPFDLQIAYAHVEEQRIISLNRFLFLSVISFGLYPIWWIFEAWRFFMQKDKLDIMPAARALLAVFFIYPLLNRIQNYARAHGHQAQFSSALMCIGYIGGSMLAQLPDPYWLISVASCIFLIPPFLALNDAKQNTPGLKLILMQKFSMPQWILIAVCSILWLLILAAMFILETPQ